MPLWPRLLAAALGVLVWHRLGPLHTGDGPVLAVVPWVLLALAVGAPLFVRLGPALAFALIAAALTPLMPLWPEGLGMQSVRVVSDPAAHTMVLLLAYLMACHLLSLDRASARPSRGESLGGPGIRGARVAWWVWMALWQPMSLVLAFSAVLVAGWVGALLRHPWGNQVPLTPEGWTLAGALVLGTGLVVAWGVLSAAMAAMVPTVAHGTSYLSVRLRRFGYREQRGLSDRCGALSSVTLARRKGFARSAALVLAAALLFLARSWTLQAGADLIGLDAELARISRMLASDAPAAVDALRLLWQGLVGQ